MARIGFALARVLPVRELMDLAVTAEELGYESLWLTEALGKDVFTALAAMATRTQRAQLGPGVTPIYTRTPTLMAMTATALDELSEGRAVLGLQMAELAGEVADGVLLNITTPDYVRQAIDRIHQGARRAGREPAEVDIRCFISTSVSSDRAAAFEAARRRIARFAANPFYANMFRAAGFPEDVEGVGRMAATGDRLATYAQVSDNMVRAVAAWGTPEECRAKVDEFIAAGVTLPLIQANNVARDRHGALLTTMKALAPAGS